MTFIGSLIQPCANSGHCFAGLQLELSMGSCRFEARWREIGSIDLLVMILNIGLQELSELAMGTFKHCGRLRSARLIGRDLSRFYIQLGQPHKAINFLVDLLRGYHDEVISYAISFRFPFLFRLAPPPRP